MGKSNEDFELMICLCTCSGESASPLEQSRKQVAVASCKICGGKPLVHGSGSLSGSMLSTVGLELTSVINPDLTWKTVSKGNRSGSRRARKPIARSLEGSGDLINKDAKRVDMSVSESEKLGVTVLGRRFGDKIEHVPIKKRRFWFRSPSPPPQIPSPHREGPEWCIKNQPASGLDSPLNSIVKQQVMAIETAVSNDLGQVVSEEIVVHEKNLEEIHEKLDDNEDFSGISILAAAACNNCIAGGAGNAEEGSTAEESFVKEGSFEVLVNTESCSMAKESFKEHSLSCAEILNDGTDLCISALPVEETAVSLETTNSSPKKLEFSSLGDRSHWDLNTVMDAWDNPCEDPFLNSQTVAINGMSEDCVHSEKLENFEDCEVQREPENFYSKYAIERTVQPMVGRDASVDGHKDVCKLPDLRSLVPGTDKSNGEKHNLDECIAPDKAYIQEGSPNDMMDLAPDTKPMHNPERSSSNWETCETVSSHQFVGEGACIDHSCSGPEQNTRKPMSKECMSEASPVDIGERTGGGCDSGAQSGGTICSSPQVEKCDVVIPDFAISKKPSHDGEDADEKPNLLVGYASKKRMSMDIRTGQAPQPGHLDYAMSNSDKVGASQDTNCEELSSIGASSGKGEHGEGIKVPDGNVSLVDDTHLNSGDLEPLGHINTESFTNKSLGQIPRVVDTPTLGSLSSHEVCRSYVDDPVHSVGKIALEGDSSNDSDNDSGDSHNDPRHLFGAEKRSELQAGYDSQYEDGELREDVEHGWEVGEEREAEHLDYGSDNIDAYGFEAAADNSMPIVAKVEGQVSCRKERSPKVDLVYYEGDQVKDKRVQDDNGQPCVGSSLKTIQSGRKRSADMEMEDNDESNKKNHAGPGMDAFISKDSMRVTRRASIQGTRSNFDDSNPRFKRDTGSVKSFGRGGSFLHLNGQGQGGAHWVDSSGRPWGQSRRHSPIYYGTADFVQPGSKNAAAAAAVKMQSSGFFVAADGTIVKAGSAGPSGQIHRQSVNGSSEGVCRSHTRRGSPSDRDEAFDMHMGFGPAGERSPDRSITIGRGRSGRYGPRMVGIGSGESYHGSIPDDCVGSLRMHHRLTRRERSFSPIHRRGAPYLSRSRRSRSRTLSPHMWSPRGRNGCDPGLGQCSVSPDPRPEARMDRVRSPHRRPGFGTDYMVGFSSTSRSRGSPPHTSRWIDDRKDAAKHLREHGYKQRSSVSGRSLPRRFFGRNHRFDLEDSPVRLRPDECYRPTHAGRFSEMVGTDRGPRCDESDDDKRKRSDRHGMVHRVRHYGADGTVKRFRYDEDDGFVVHNSHGNDTSEFHGRVGVKDFVGGIDSRTGDAPRRAREDKDHFRYSRERKYTANSKSFGMRESNEDVAPRRRRPS